MDKEQQKIRLSALFNAGKLGIEPGKLTGSVSVPQSKSVAHRALIMAFLAGDVSLAKVDLEHASDDILATRAALLKLQEYADRKEMSEDDTPLQIDCCKHNDDNKRRGFAAAIVHSGIGCSHRA